MDYHDATKPLNIHLRQRGLLRSRYRHTDNLIVPVHIVENDVIIPDSTLRPLRDALHRSTFRKLLRKLITAQGAPLPLEQLLQIAGTKTEGYLQVLAPYSILEWSDDHTTVRLLRSLNNFGPTFEWYVADLCEQAFNASSDWAVHFEDMPAGGDYDVLASLELGLLAIETKTAAPGAITENELRSFLRRNAELRPEMTIFLVDTDDDLTELVGRLVNCARFTVPGWPKLTQLQGSPVAIAPAGGYPGVFFGAPNVYVSNIAPSVHTQLSRCLRHHFQNRR